MLSYSKNKVLGGIQCTLRDPIGIKPFACPHSVCSDKEEQKITNEIRHPSAEFR
jgi:hypothetical protein